MAIVLQIYYKCFMLITNDELVKMQQLMAN